MEIFLSFCKIILELCLLMANIPNFWRGERKFTATPWRLFCGAGEKHIMRVGVNIFLDIMGVFLYHGVWMLIKWGGDFRFKISVNENNNHTTPHFLLKE